MEKYYESELLGFLYILGASCTKLINRGTFACAFACFISKIVRRVSLKFGIVGLH
jgi:hypothetical protein